MLDWLEGDKVHNSNVTEDRPTDKQTNNGHEVIRRASFLSIRAKDLSRTTMRLERCVVNSPCVTYNFGQKTLFIIVFVCLGFITTHFDFFFT